MTLVAIICLVWIFYVYVGYPLVIAALASVRPKHTARGSEHLPAVSVLIPAYNESEHIESTIRNKLELDFPGPSLEVLVVSDESDDGTDELVEQLATEFRGRVRLHRQVPRQGKTAGINALAEMASGEILMFSDANSIWGPTAATKLAAAFNDPSVGYVTGKMVYTSADGSIVGDGCSAYMRYENFLRACESRVGSVVGVDGGIDAMRRDLYVPLRADQLPDFVQPLKVVASGHRVVYEPEAVLAEEALADEGDEMSMRVRVTLRALWALKDMAHLLDPTRRPLFAFQLLSHKVLRYLAWIPLVLLLPTSIALGDEPFWALLATVQLLGYGVVAATLFTPGFAEVLPVRLARYFVLLNLASARASYSFLRGERKVVWNPRKG